MPIAEYGDQEKGYEGQLANPLDCKVRTAVNVDATGIAIGSALVKGANEEDGTVATATGSTFSGVCVQYDIYDKDEPGARLADGREGIAPKRRMGRLIEGDVFVYVDTAVTHTDQVFFRHTAGAGDKLVGRFSNSADGGTCDAIDTDRIEFKENGGPGLVRAEVKNA